MAPILMVSHMGIDTTPIIAKMQAVNGELPYDSHMSTDNGLTFGEWLDDELKRRGWLQDDFAVAIGVDQSTVSDWVNGQSRPQPKNCDAIARKLGVDRNEVRRRAGRRQIIQAAHIRSRSGAIGGITVEATAGDVKRQWDALGRVIPEEELKPLVDYLKRVYGIDP